MNYYFITGTSTGIGKALAEILITDKNNCVIGFSRSCSVIHPNFAHISIDLSDISKLSKNIAEWLKKPTDAEKVVLINNAGTVGEVGYVGELSNRHFETLFNLNITAPAIIINEFLRIYRNHQGQKLILNISSGAAQYPVDGWAAYCASKAALDLFTSSIAKEIDIRGNGTKVFSIAPGIVDTPMQETIRTISHDKFSGVQKFIEYKNKGHLATPQATAKKLMQIIENPKNYEESVLDIRKI